MSSKIKRFVIMPLLLATLLVGGTAGVVMADEEVEATAETPRASFMEIVAGNLGVTVDELRDAMCEARETVQDIEDREARYEEFKAVVSELLGLDEGAFQEAIDQAKETIKERIEQNRNRIREQNEERKAEMREQLEARKAEMQGQLEQRRTQMREQLEERKAEMQEQLEQRRTRMREQLEERKAEMQEQIQERKVERQAQRESRKAGVQSQRNGWQDSVTNGTGTVY